MNDFYVSKVKPNSSFISDYLVQEATIISLLLSETAFAKTPRKLDGKKQLERSDESKPPALQLSFVHFLFVVCFAVRYSYMGMWGNLLYK